MKLRKSGWVCIPSVEVLETLPADEVLCYRSILGTVHRHAFRHGSSHILPGTHHWTVLWPWTEQSLPEDGTYLPR